MLRLFVSDSSASTRAAINQLHTMCAEQFPERYHIEVINVREHPELADEERILATPTVIRRLPEPVRRVIGDLSDAGRVLSGLELLPVRSATPDQPRREPDP